MNILTTQTSIVKRLIDGSVTINSVEEFENIVKIFSNDPGVYRAFADLLAKKKSRDTAARNYRIATRLYLEQGMLLQAVVSKILEWRIKKPTHQEGRAFYRAIQVNASVESPSDRFLATMAYPELVAFMVKLVRVRYPEDTLIKKEGDGEETLFFIVSGRMRETIYKSRPGAGGEKKSASTDLVKNHFFGSIYPFETEISSPSDVETITRVELVKISRDRVKDICAKYPNVEKGLKALYDTYIFPGERNADKDEREAKRHEFSIPFILKIFSRQTDQDPFVVDGVTEDISSGGVCVLLGGQSDPGSPKELVGKDIWIEIDLPTAEVTIKVFGTIVWSKAVLEKEEQETALGIQFKELSNQDRSLLDDYCHGGDGEQKLMWRLWESYTKPPPEE